MGRIAKTVTNLALLGGTGIFVWNRFLNKKAKASLKQAASSTAGLVTHLLDQYTGASSHDSKSEQAAAEKNRAWVKNQWEKAGY